MVSNSLELDSFYTKFKHLLNSGYNATLTLESIRGEAFVCLKAGLDSDPVNFPQNSSKLSLIYDIEVHRINGDRKEEESYS